MKDLISRQAAINELMKRDKALRNINWYDKPFAEGECKGIDDALEIINALPSAQPELIERTAYIRGFEQGRTQGMIDSQAEKSMIKAEWTNADTLDLQQTCNNLATDCISRQMAIDSIRRIKANYCETADDQILLIDKAMAMTELMILPSSQPESKKGKWIKGQDVPNRKLYYHLKDALYCSVCYKEAYWDTDYGQQLFAYCPHCGAEMEVEG